MSKCTQARLFLDAIAHIPIIGALNSTKTDWASSVSFVLHKSVNVNMSSLSCPRMRAHKNEFQTGEKDNSMKTAFNPNLLQFFVVFQCLIVSIRVHFSPFILLFGEKVANSLWSLYSNDSIRLCLIPIPVNPRLSQCEWTRSQRFRTYCTGLGKPHFLFIFD